FQCRTRVLGAVVLLRGRTVAPMAKVLIVAGLAALAFAVYAIVDCSLTGRSQVRGLPRWAWFAVIVLLPVIGGLLWFLIGSGRRQRTAPAARVIGPDDDPEFLRSRGTGPVATSTPVDEDEWRRLEQELAGVDSDTEGDDEGEPRRR
ncbi:UNVERIFIED_CONTAM: PLD nuclease N-terminal domain-containing protein, partial [Campylobacter lari]